MGQILIHAKADTMDSLYKLLRLRGKDIGKMVYRRDPTSSDGTLPDLSTPFLNAVKEQISGVDISSLWSSNFLIPQSDLYGVLICCKRIG